MNNKELIIRKASDEDLSQIAKVHSSCFSRQINSLEWVQCNFKAYPRILFYVAAINSQIIGYIQWIQKSGFRANVVLELEQMAVDPNHQNQGIGSKLISDSLSDIKELFSHQNRTLKNVIVTTRLDNAAQRIYKKVLDAKEVAVIKDLYSSDEVIMLANC